MRNKLLVWTSAFALMLGFAAAAYANGSAAKEIKTAHAHALMAQGASSLDMAHTHLHHVVNCLVGPDGEAFDTAAGNPCKGMGDGAIDDASGNAALQSKLKNALAHAQAGLQADALEAAHKHAAKAVAALEVTPTQKDSGGYSW